MTYVILFSSCLRNLTAGGETSRERGRQVERAGVAGTDKRWGSFAGGVSLGRVRRQMGKRDFERARQLWRGEGFGGDKEVVWWLGGEG